ncbi:MAG: NAD-dependent epimerase/dehydratase family protein [Deltaproteobacteria bacterium]|nr:NAD-dependent epimerase/dehydratase family protein [Deltaproteobacteria bacterium]
MRALITGANGFLGSHLVDVLLESGWQVGAMVRESSNLRFLEGKEIALVFGDVSLSPSELAPRIEGADVVFHLAGVTKALDRSTFFRINQKGTDNLLRACLQAKAPRFVLASSLGASGPSPTAEPITERDQREPVTAYGLSKLAAEHEARRYRDRLAISVLRPGAIYGPRDLELLPAFQAVQRGLAPTMGVVPRMINMIHVRDAARAFMLAGTEERAVGETFLVATHSLTQPELYAHIKTILGKRALLPVPIPTAVVRLAALASSLACQITRKPRIFCHGNVRRFVEGHWAVDGTKARELLGLEPEFDLGPGLADTVAWYRNQGLLGVRPRHLTLE